MNKKLALLILPLMGVVGCAASQIAFEPFIDQAKNVPTIHMSNSEHTTYLMLTRYGYLELDGEKVVGGKIPERYFENTVAFMADEGEALPEAKSTVAGAIFRGWAYYSPDSVEGNPEYLTKVPAVANLALKAIFDGPTGGGGVGPIDPEAKDITYTVTALPYWMADDNPAVFAWCWGGNAGNGTWYKMTLNKTGEGTSASVSATFVAPNNIEGFNMARCVKGTVSPNWDVRDNGEGRVYNKSGDITIISGVTSYASSDWSEYNGQ